MQVRLQFWMEEGLKKQISEDGGGPSMHLNIQYLKNPLNHSATDHVQSIMVSSGDKDINNPSLAEHKLPMRFVIEYPLRDILLTDWCWQVLATLIRN